METSTKSVLHKQLLLVIAGLLRYETAVAGQLSPPGNA